MKKTVFLIAAMACASLANAQKDFQGMAVYQSKTSTADFMANLPKNREITPDMQKMMEERMKKMFEKTFVLNFDQSASIYKEEEKLDAPGSNASPGRRMFASFMGGGGTFYKNVKDKRYTVDKEFLGKEFLIKDALPQLNWVMTGETKQIGGYTCYKATVVRPTSQSDFRNYRRRNPDENKASEVKKDSSVQKTNLLDQFEMPKDKTVTAWYTPDIPVNQGPDDYWGLPGLILEVNDGKTVILCSKVVLNPKDKVQIKAPTNGKEVGQKEYDEIVLKKMQEMREQGGFGGPGGNHMRFGN